MLARKPQFHGWTYIVEGSGSFPVDMLRYDWSAPFSELDSAGIAQSDGKRRVKLVRFCRGEFSITQARWASFGWTLVPNSVCLLE